MVELPAWAKRPDVPYKGMIDRVNFVVDHWANPCDAPFIVYVETFLRATPILVWTFIDFSVFQFLRGMFRPYRMMQRGRGHRRLGRWARWSNMGDLGNESGKRAGNFFGFRGRYVSDGIRHLWIFDEGLQRAMFWWMVVDATTDFAYTWTSLLYETEYCQEAHTPRVMWENMPVGSLSLVGWEGIGVSTLVYAHHTTSASAGSHPSGDRTWHHAFFARVSNPSINTANYEIGIFYDTAGTNPIAVAGPVAIPPGASATLTVSARCPPRHTANFMTRTTGATATSAIEGYRISRASNGLEQWT